MLEVAVYSLAFRCVPFSIYLFCILHAAAQFRTPRRLASRPRRCHSTRPRRIFLPRRPRHHTHACHRRFRRRRALPRLRPLDARTPVAAVSDSVPPRPAAALLARPPPFSTSPRPDAHATGLSTQHHPAPLPLESCPPPDASAPRLGPRRRLTRCHRAFRHRRAIFRLCHPSRAPSRSRVSPRSLTPPRRPGSASPNARPPLLFPTPRPSATSPACHRPSDDVAPPSCCRRPFRRRRALPLPHLRATGFFRRRRASLALSPSLSTTPRPSLPHLRATRFFDVATLLCVRATRRPPAAAVSATPPPFPTPTRESPAAPADSTAVFDAAVLPWVCATRLVPAVAAFDAVTPFARATALLDTAAPLRVRALLSSFTSDPPWPRVEAAARVQPDVGAAPSSLAVVAPGAAVATLDAAVSFLDARCTQQRRCFFSTSLCSTSPAVFLERVTVPYRTGHSHAAVCAARLTPATTVSDTAPLRYATCVCHPAFRRWNPWPHDLTVAFDAAGRLCVRWKEGMICRSCPPSTSTHRMAFFIQRVVALGGQQVAGIQLLGALTFSSRRKGDVLKNIEWALVPQNERRPFLKTPHLFLFGLLVLCAAGSVMY
ncbi:hypothetical protein MSAN_02528200 [Mycena sanguinolenta]|uniref:Uncharacterized protein n=1 Tax=Mycena sanguinolenta TaxID=230812 RepID=A0A8H6TX22_9AGAR|nr:hypothetical protein MSAN_02528200 [Mycena sanguinolenta]